ncbi:single-stranded-DNA-specific exonuclease RecJ [Evansella sp. LMS18]|uniref:single-stranded-DNA-specific exonuclease RecJ n=1 Tax=Evansella sp. LMS18 TaxID=2924033 RepID=UPI0020D0DF91|nr:single-stranded-DNA-specific exonuclease RecJ [Evansella sp. LMS18]UTR09271.1 single-stranded-DNA-specific exonuclease RecJ [Evansella sp. LMS18]
MLTSKARWKVSETDELKVNYFSEQLGLSKIASRFLVQRGFTEAETAKTFLNIDESCIHSPYLLKDMEKAIERIKEGIRNKEKILIFGDYDADGVTSTSLMFLTLRELGAQVGYYVPNRFTEGYGPNEGAFRQAKEEGVSLIITVDTGISAVYEAEVAKDLGIDLIITDHHEPPPEIPDAYAVINPKQEDCFYPNPNLAGVGVAGKTAHALLGGLPEQYLDLIAIGTIADLVPLTDENRFFASEGIRRLSKVQRPGLKALMDHCGINPQELTEESVGFGIGPRLNAAGRMDSADPAVQLLISEDMLEADELAVMIDDLNKERQKVVADIAEEAERQVEEQGLSSVIIVGNEGWNAGVIGIVASRLTEKYYRPSIVLSIDSETGLAKGSARSIEGFDMFRSLSQCRDWLPHFGGHPMAAGLTMKTEHIQPLQKKMNEIAEATVQPEDWIRSLSVDLPVKLSEVTVEAIKDLQMMAPFGVGNPSPKILLDGVNLSVLKKIGSKKDHLKVTFKESNNMVDGIGFRMGELYDEISPNAKASVVGKLSINEWNGHVKPQVIIEDMKVDEWQLFDLRGLNDPWKQMEHLAPETVLVTMWNKESGEMAKKLPDNWEILQLPEGPEHTVTDLTKKNVLLFDLPGSMEDLKELFQKHGKPGRIYAAFIHDKDHFFEMLPTRDHFKWFYAFLIKRKSFNLQENAESLSAHKGWPVTAVHFICKVFFELGFVTINNGVVELKDNPEKKDLTESASYRRQLEQSDIEDKLFYSSNADLKQLFEGLLEETSFPVSAE